MKENITILLVDPYPIVLLGYQRLLEKYKKDIPFKMESAKTISDALKVLEGRTTNYFHLIILDIDSKDKKINMVLTGEDLGTKIQRKSPKSKIIALTMFDNAIKINSVVSNLNPNGLLIKSQTTPQLLWKSILTVLRGDKFYSQGIHDVLSQNASTTTIDCFDRKIIHYLSLGEKMKNLPQILPLSMPSIERRKKKIKRELGIPDGTDRQLLYEAEKSGFL